MISNWKYILKLKHKAMPKILHSNFVPLTCKIKFSNNCGYKVCMSITHFLPRILPIIIKILREKRNNLSHYRYIEIQLNSLHLSFKLFSIICSSTSPCFDWTNLWMTFLVSQVFNIHSDQEFTIKFLWELSGMTGILSAKQLLNRFPRQNPNSSLFLLDITMFFAMQGRSFYVWSMIYYESQEVNQV